MYLNVDNGRFLYNCNCSCIPLKRHKKTTATNNDKCRKIKDKKVQKFQKFSLSCLYLSKFVTVVSHCLLNFSLSFIFDCSFFPRHDCSKLGTSSVFWKQKLSRFASYPIRNGGRIWTHVSNKFNSSKCNNFLVFIDRGVRELQI
jgi:hypothetical protein